MRRPLPPAVNLRMCAAAASSSSQVGFRWPWDTASTEPGRQILRLTAPARLRAEASAAAEAVASLEAGDLVEASGEFDVVGAPPEGGWLLVRSSLEDKIDVMSDKPLEYQDGWLAIAPPATDAVAAAERASADGGEAAEDGQPQSPAGPLLERTALQLGDKVAARVHPESHPVLGLLKKVPHWRDNGLPSWMRIAVAEIYAGRVGGVVQRGRFLIQRPSGAMPERVAVKDERIVVPRERAKETAICGLIGLAASLVIGSIVHARAWMKGDSVDHGLRAWPLLVGWATLVTVFLAPIVAAPCYTFANTQAATVTVVVWMNLLLYNDLFAE